MDEERKVEVWQAFGRYYDLLKSFLPPEEGVSEIPCLTLSELAEITERDMANLLKLVKKLVDYGLLVPREKVVENRVRKCYALSELGFRLFKSFKEAFESPKQKEVETEAEVESWKVEELLKIVEGEWSEELRYKCASKLFELVNKKPVVLLSKCQVLRKRFEDWLTSPPLDDKVGERLRATVYCSIARLAQDESTRDWVLSSLYPKMRELLRHPSPEAKKWAASMLEDVALCSGSPEKRAEIVDLLLSVLLDKGVDLDKEPYNYVVKALAYAMRELSESEKERFFERLKHIADKGRKQEVERLLDVLISHAF
jgi:DNA-binding PadR family transcriptional regulator